MKMIGRRVVVSTDYITPHRKHAMEGPVLIG